MTQIAFYITSFILDDDVPYHGDTKKAFVGLSGSLTKFKLLGATFTPSLETIVCISFVLWLKFNMCFIWQPIQTGQCRVLAP